MLGPLIAFVAMYASGDEYAAMYYQSLRENRPLVVWVNCFSMATEMVLEECLHCRVAEFPEAEAPCVVVARPNGRGGLTRLADVPRGDVSSSSIRAVLARPRSQEMPAVMWGAAAPAQLAPRVGPAAPARGCSS